MDSAAGPCEPWVWWEAGSHGAGTRLPDAETDDDAAATAEGEPTPGSQFSRRAASLLYRYRAVVLLALYLVVDKVLLRDRGQIFYYPGASSDGSSDASSVGLGSTDGVPGPMSVLRWVQPPRPSRTEGEPAAPLPWPRRLENAGATNRTHDVHASHGHPQEAMYFFVIALAVGVATAHIMVLPLFRGLQQTVVLFVLGMVFSFFLEAPKLWELSGPVGRSYSMWMDINGHLLLFTMIPPLVTGEAMTIDTTVARRVSLQCVFLAGPAMVVNAFASAFFLWVYIPYSWSFLLCLTTGAILCATDPVAVVALLKELGASPVLTVQIQGESLLNDGTAIVLYTIAYEMLKGEEFYVDDVIFFLSKTVIIALGLGMLIGYSFYMWIKLANNRLEHCTSIVQIGCTLCCAYASFIVAEGIFHVSGVLSTVAASLVLAHKMWPEVISKHAMHTFWHLLEFLGNTTIFFLAGALTGHAMVDISFADYIHLIVIYIVLTIVRGVVLLASMPLLRRLGGENEKVQIPDALVMTWGGLRGAIGLSLAIMVSEDKAGGRVHSDDANRVLFYVSGIAALTLMINATTSPAVVKWLGVTQLPTAKQKMLNIINQRLIDVATQGEHNCHVRAAIKNMLNDVESHICQHAHPSTTTGNVALSPTNSSSFARAKSNGREKVFHFLAKERHEKRQNGDAILSDFDIAKQKFTEIKVEHEQHLVDLPEIPFSTQEEDMRDLLEEPMDLDVMRAVNEAMLSLIASEYQHMLEEGDFSMSFSEAKQLLTSVSVARDISFYDLCDFQYIEPFILCDYQKSYGRISALHIQKTQEHLGMHRQGVFGSIIHTIAESIWFTLFITAAIAVNAVWAMTLNENARIKDGLIMEVIFSAVFTTEFVIKFAHLGRFYFISDGGVHTEVNWNRFDFAMVILGIGGVFFSAAFATENSGEKRVRRVNQVLRLIRILRLVRLIHVYTVLKASMQKSYVSLEVREHMQKTTILTNCIRAHIKGQQRLVVYFGQNDLIHIPELARTILQSQVVCYKCMTLLATEKSELEPALVEEIRIANESKELAEELERFVDGAQKCKILSAHEAESILTPVHTHVRMFLKILHDGHKGRLSCMRKAKNKEQRRCSGEQRRGNGRVAIPRYQCAPLEGSKTPAQPDSTCSSPYSKELNDGLQDGGERVVEGEVSNNKTGKPLKKKKKSKNGNSSAPVSGVDSGDAPLQTPNGSHI